MGKPGDEMIVDRLQSIEDQLRVQASTLDGKAGLYLVVLTFLADTIVHMHHFNGGLAAALVIESISGLLAVASLAISPHAVRDYTQLAEARDTFQKQLAGKSQQQINDEVETEVASQLVKYSTEDIRNYKDRNGIKSKLLMGAYFTMVFSLALVVFIAGFQYFRP